MPAGDSEYGDGTGDDVSFVISSRYRTVVMHALREGAATPSTIAGEADVGITHVSRALQRLRDRGVVELLVSEDRKKGRLYGLSESGERLWNQHEDVLARNGGDA
jgi:DNA-binding MarR family transcriptional regulator